ncbi:MAG: tyrosine-type recombinase/integrase [Cyanobacteria bacterium P01_H01_bin.121]
MKKTQKRASKGSVSVSDRNGRLQLRWSYQGKPFYLAAGPNNPVNYQAAQAKKFEIQADIAYSRFDVTLAKYKPEPLVEDQEGWDTVTLFAAFTQAREQAGTSRQTIAAKYRCLATNLKAFGRDITTEQEGYQFAAMLRSQQSPTVANQNLVLLKAFGKWCINTGKAEVNPFINIHPVTNGRRCGSNRYPFSKAEIKAFLATLKTHPKLYCYHDFCLVFFNLGLRPSELIGLRWKHLDLPRKQVLICESLVQSRDKGVTEKWIRKTTKTGRERMLRLSDRLVAMFEGRAMQTHDRKPDELIFTAPNGQPIDGRHLTDTLWKPICLMAGIEYRPPYAARHGAISHGMEKFGWTDQQAADFAGHSSVRLVQETYRHALEVPEPLDLTGE